MRNAAPARDKWSCYGVFTGYTNQDPVCESATEEMLTDDRSAHRFDATADTLMAKAMA